jgi:hypothetical protein
MENFFTKPLDQVDANDIKGLIDTPEGQLFEIKSQLAADKNGRDLWYESPEDGKTRKGPSDYAKQNIFKEVVAFANSEGGWIVIGLEETSDHPKRVAGIAEPLRDCHELAERLKRASYDWIDPPLPSLQCRGIDIGNPGEGVIVFRVPRSFEAPHRLYKKNRTQEAYKRVGDESKPMRMREIQDMTLDMARGQERVDREFNNARERYLLLQPQQSTKKMLLGFYIALIPLSGPVTIDRPYLEINLFRRKTIFEGLWSNRQKLNIETIDAPCNKKVSQVKPILRGAMKTWSCAYNHPSETQIVNEDFVTVEILESGIVQLSCKSTYDNPPGLSIRWILADLSNALCIADLVRSVGGMPDAEYVMQIEFIYEKIALDGKSFFTETKFKLGLLAEEDYRFSQLIGPTPILLPRYRIGGKLNFPKIVKLVMDDLYNAVGKPHIDNFDFNIKW